MNTYNLNYKWSNFSRYDRSGRRLSIFCDILNKKELIITVIPCAKKDIFNKEIGKQLFYANFGVKYIVPIIEDKPIRTFMDWCKENYYKKFVKQIYNGNKMGRIKENIISINFKNNILTIETLN